MSEMHADYRPNLKNYRISLNLSWNYLAGSIQMKNWISLHTYNIPIDKRSIKI